MALLEQATDAIERSIQGRSVASLLTGGAALVAVGVVGTLLLARAIDGAIPRPVPPPDAPRLAQMPAGWSALGRVIAWLALRLGQGPPASFRPALLPLCLLVVLGAATLGARITAGTAGTETAPATSDPAVPVPASDAAPAPDLHAFAITTALVAAALLLFLATWTRSHGGSLADVGISRRGVGRALLLALALYVVYAPVQLGAMALENGAWQLAGRAAPPQAAVAAFATDLALRRDPIVLAGLVVCAPIFEELLFRGVLQRFLSRLFPGRPDRAGWLAIAGTAACFTLPHDGGRLAVFALGLALSWLMARTGNLLAPLLFHMLHNGLVLVLIATTSAP